MNKIRELFCNDWHFNVFYGLLLLAMVTLPITNFLMLPIALLMLINWISEWNWTEKWHNLRSWQALPALICFSLVFLSLIPGLVISCNKDEALAAFDCSTWLAVAPLVLLTTKPDKMTVKRLRVLLGIFVLSTLIHIFIILSVAFYKFLTTGKTLYFYYSPLSILKHPSYVAMYCTFSFFILLEWLRSRFRQISFSSQIILMAMMAFLLTAIILLQSKAGLLSLITLVFFWIIYRFCILQRKTAVGIILSIVVLAAVALIFQSGWIKKNRIQESIEQIQQRKSNPYGTNSSEMRLTLWKCSWEVAMENMPWGVGTGDATEELNLHALKMNYTNLIGRHYNAHCQYLQTLMETGILGLLCLLAFCFYSLAYSIRHKNFLYFSFAIMIIINIAVECMFKVRSGTNFIALANILLFIYCSKAKSDHKICEKATDSSSF